MKDFRSIRAKLLAVVLATTFCALLVASAVFLVYDIRSFRDFRLNDMRTQMELLAYATIPALQSADPAVANDSLQVLRLRPSVQAAAIYDARGSLFASYVREGDSHEFPVLPGDTGVIQEADRMVIFERIVENGEILGMAYMSADYLLGERIGSFFLIFVLVVACAMLVAVLVSLQLQRTITRPLLSIVAVTRSIAASGQYDKRARQLSKDEVGELVVAFNAMLDVIETRTAELESTNANLGLEMEKRAQAAETISQLNAALESKVRERTRQLETINNELESFCYSVSHDLRGPLRSISGFSQALLEELPMDLDGDPKRYLDKIFAATRRMGQLIEDLLNLSKVSRSELKCQEVDVSTMAREILQELQARDPGLNFDLSVWGGIVVDADPKLLRIALENLLGNAWKFTAKKDKPRIVVGVMRESGREVIFVRDNGAGFDMQYADKLFGAFQRLHSMQEFPGTGIGLAIVQRIVHRHGGRIWFDSAPGNGTVFHFTLRDDAAPADSRVTDVGGSTGEEKRGAI